VAGGVNVDLGIVFRGIPALFRNRSRLTLENLALRQQIAVTPTWAWFPLGAYLTEPLLLGPAENAACYTYALSQPLARIFGNVR
jgi:hypothetical protein